MRCDGIVQLLPLISIETMFRGCREEGWAVRSAYCSGRGLKLSVPTTQISSLRDASNSNSNVSVASSWFLWTPEHTQVQQ